MERTLRVRRSIWRPALVFGMALLSMQARAQSHVEKEGRYVLRSSSVSTMNLPADVVRRQGFERGEGHAILNVVVQKVGRHNELTTVPADVTAQVRTLAGVVQEVEMKKTKTNGYVAYAGSYTFLPREVIDIAVTATPEGARYPLEMSYRERMWVER